MEQTNKKKNNNSYLHLSKAVVRHFIHEAVEQGRRAGLIYSKFSLRGEVVTLLQGKTTLTLNQS